MIISFQDFITKEVLKLTNNIQFARESNWLVRIISWIEWANSTTCKILFQTRPKFAWRIAKIKSMNSLLLRPIIPTRKLSRNVRNSVFWWKSSLRKCHFVTYLVKRSNAFPLLWSGKFDPKWKISLANLSKGTFFKKGEVCSKVE